MFVNDEEGCNIDCTCCDSFAVHCWLYVSDIEYEDRANKCDYLSNGTAVGASSGIYGTARTTIWPTGSCQRRTINYDIKNIADVNADAESIASANSITTTAVCCATCRSLLSQQAPRGTLICFSMS